MRMAHGESMKEAAYTAAKAIMAAVNGEKRIDKKNKDIAYLHLDQYKAVVSLQWEGAAKVWMITGYREEGKHSSAGDKRKGFALFERYALDSFTGRNQVGAALDYAISRLAQEYKQNNADPARKLRKNYNGSQLSTLNIQNQTSNFSITSEATLQTWQIDKAYGLSTLGSCSASSK